MKKSLKIIALLLILAIALSSCGTSNNTNNDTNARSKYFDENGYWQGITASEYVTLCDTSNIEIKQSQIDEQKESFLDTYQGTKEVKDRAVVDGDSLNIDYVGKVDGVEFEGGSTNGAGTDVTIGVTSYIDGFLDQLIGHFPGETFDINVTFPDPYTNNEELSGKPAVFTITINYITEYIRQTWSDSFVNDYLSEEYGWTTMAEAEAEFKSALVEDYILDNSEFKKDVPQTMTDFITDSAVEYYQGYADYYNMSLDDFIKYFLGYEGIEAFREAYKSTAQSNGKFYLLYQAIAERDGVKITDDDVNKYFEGNDQYDEILEYYGLPYIKAMIMYEQVMDKIVDSAKIV